MSGDLCGDLSGGWHWTTKGLDELPAALAELRSGQAVGFAEGNHVDRPGAGLFDVAGKKERFGNERVMRDRGVGMAKGFRSQGRGELAGIPNFQTVREEDDLDGGVGGVVAVGDGVDDGFCDSLARQFVLDWGLRPLGATVGDSNALKLLTSIS